MYFCSICLETYANIKTAMECCTVEKEKAVRNLSKKTHKTCSICEEKKLRSEFAKSKKAIGISEYCLECGIKHDNNEFILNHCDFVIDAVPRNIADTLIVHKIIEYKRYEYRVLNEAFYRKQIKHKNDPFDESDYLLALGKYDEKRYAVHPEKATQLVDEGAAVWEDDRVIRHLFSGKELEEHVVARDNGICYYCKKEGDRITFLFPRSQGGLLSPANSVTACKPCKETHGENLFFFKWVNVPILEKEEREKEKNVYGMYDKEKQTLFPIKESDAKTLVEEELAAHIDEKTIHILYNKKEFWEFIRKRDGGICYYCEKKGDTIDHIIPQSQGGMTTPKNCVCACAKCNEQKNDFEQEKFIEMKKRKRKSN